MTEPKCPSSPSTTSVSLEKYIIDLMDERDKRLNQRLDAIISNVKLASDSAEKALMKAETATEERFRGVNEFRAALTDQTATFIRRGEYEIAHRSMDDKLNRLIQRFDSAEGRGSGLNQGWGYIIAFISTAAAIITAIVVVVKH